MGSALITLQVRVFLAPASSRFESRSGTPPPVVWPHWACSRSSAGCSTKERTVRAPIARAKIASICPPFRNPLEAWP
jgi:hypothetical protein